jgi:hypothetical protein
MRRTSRADGRVFDVLAFLTVAATSALSLLLLAVTIGGLVG